MISKIKNDLYKISSFLNNDEFTQLGTCIKQSPFSRREPVYVEEEQMYYPSGEVLLSAPGSFNFADIFIPRAVAAIKEVHNVDVHKELGVDITVYFPGEGLPYHWDGASSDLKTPSGHPRRDISTVFYPGSSFSGGRLFFKNFDLIIEPEENMFITFPSSELYTHKVEKVTSGMRYTCPGFWAIKE